MIWFIYASKCINILLHFRTIYIIIRAILLAETHAHPITLQNIAKPITKVLCNETLDAKGQHVRKFLRVFNVILPVLLQVKFAGNMWPNSKPLWMKFVDEYDDTWRW